MFEFIRKIKYADCFNYHYIDKIYNAHLRKKKNYSNILWTLLVFDKWIEIFNIAFSKLKQNFKQIIFKDKKKIKFLIINIAGIGDFFRLIPYLSALREYFEDSEIDLIVSDKTFSYAKDCPYVNKVYFLSSKEDKIYVDIRRIFDVIKVLRKNTYDFVVNTYEISSLIGSLKMWFFLSLIKAKNYIGRNTNSLGFFYDIKIADNTKDKNSQYYYYRRIVQALGVPERLIQQKENDTEKTLWINKEADFKVNNLLLSCGINDKDCFIVINPSSGRKTRQWLPERFAEVCNELYSKYKFKFVIVGENKDLEMVNKITNLLNFKAAILCGKTNIEDLIIILKKSKLVITTNSLVMHIAGLLNKPLVGLMGSGNIYRDRPFSKENKIVLIKKPISCSPCYYYECPKKEEKYMLCMKKIESKDVLIAVQSLLSLEAKQM